MMMLDLSGPRPDMELRKREREGREGRERERGIKKLEN